MSDQQRFAAPWGRRWAPALLWATCILVLTSWPNPALPVEVDGADKAAHLGVYAVLGWLVGRAILGPRTLGTTLTAFAGLAAFGAVDELHQLLIPGRFATAADWVADVAGAACGLAVAQVLSRSHQPSSERTA